MWHILTDDEGVISRRQWWAGTLFLIALQFALGWLVARHFGASGLDGAIMLFVSIALLIPFHSVNAKRLRAIGQPPGLALAAGALVLAVILLGAFLPGHAINIPLGLALLVVIVLCCVLLGVYDPPQKVDVAAFRRGH